MHDRTKFRCGLAILAALLMAAQPFVSAQQQQHHQKNKMPLAERHESRHEIDTLEAVWRTAQLKGDATALESLLADDYLAILPNGMLQTKDQALEGVRSGKVHISTMELSDRKVRFYGTTALVTSRAEVTGVSPFGPLNGAYRYTRVWARDAHGTWKIVSFEANRIHEVEERQEHK